MSPFRRTLTAPGRYEGDALSDRREWVQRRPWPRNLRFTDAATERVIEQHLPPRPITVPLYGCSAGACADAPLDESIVDERVQGPPRAPRSL